MPLSSAKFEPISPEILNSLPSPAWVTPHWVSNSKPWKFLRRMKFTTPPTASAPYTAEAPPVITSTRSIRAEGMVLTSVTIRPFCGISRRPSASTRFRFGPRPRRLRVEMPMELVAVGCTSPEFATPVMF